MSTPETNFETVVDESSDQQRREQAIEGLEAANECDMLAELALNGDLEDRYREQAVSSLGHPQCKSTLETLVEDEAMPEDLRKQARTLLDETPDSAGAGP